MQTQIRPLPSLCGALHSAPLLRPHCVMADCLSKAAICCSALNRSSAPLPSSGALGRGGHSGTPSGFWSVRAWPPVSPDQCRTWPRVWPVLTTPTAQVAALALHPPTSTGDEHPRNPWTLWRGFSSGVPSRAHIGIRTGPAGGMGVKISRGSIRKIVVPSCSHVHKMKVFPRYTKSYLSNHADEDVRVSTTL